MKVTGKMIERFAERISFADHELDDELVTAPIQAVLDLLPDPGERIRADGDGGWVHAACQELTGAAACGRCFLVHKGECP